MRRIIGERLLLTMLSAGAILLTALPAPAWASPERQAGTVRELQAPLPGEIGPDIHRPAQGLPDSPPEDPQVGDSWLWWLWVHDPMPPHFEQAVCTVRGKSDRCYVVVRDEEWLVSVDQSDVDLILERWENSSIGPWPSTGIYELDSLAFGEPPDEIDMDPRIYLVYFDFGIAADGFFFWFDEYPEGTFPEYHSNECEVLYLNPYSSGGPSGNYMLAVAAHEFEHMIHWKHDEDEASWVNEGMAELAMWLYGAPDNISSFNSNPDNSLVVWDGTWADYIKTYLWSLYFYERYGGLPAAYAVVHEQANSITGYENVLDALGFSVSFADVFADWVVANFLDDTSIGDGRFGYIGDDLPAFSVSGTYSGYPLPWTYKTVNHWAADYYRFQGFGAVNSILLSFDGSDNTTYSVRGMVLRSGETPEVLTMPLEPSGQYGSLLVTDLSDPADQVVLSVANTSSSGSAGYQFKAEDAAGVESHPGNLRPALSIRAGRCPFSGAVTVTIDWQPDCASQAPSLEIFDFGGRLVRSLAVPEGGSGSAEVVWDACEESGSPAPPGCYFAVARLEGSSAAARLVLLGR